MVYTLGRGSSILHQLEGWEFDFARPYMERCINSSFPAMPPVSPIKVYSWARKFRGEVAAEMMAATLRYYAEGGLFHIRTNWMSWRWCRTGEKDFSLGEALARIIEKAMAGKKCSQEHLPLLLFAAIMVAVGIAGERTEKYPVFKNLR